MSVLRQNANFKWLMRGSVIALLGDQMTMIALPWLVLKLTGDTLALGLVIALMSIPRAVFILIGGALVDRYSPKRVFMLSKLANAVLLALLTLLVLCADSTRTVALSDTLSLTIALTSHMTLQLIYLLALGIGLAQAFGMPSATSIMPLAIPPEQLQAANGVMMGLRQVSMLVGPLLAAGLLAISGDKNSGAVSNAGGLALAFGIDCASYLISAWTLSRVKLNAPQQAEAPQSVLRSVGEGLRMVWNDLPLRLCLSYWGIVSLLIGGAMQVAIPVLAADLHGASTLGVLMAAHGAGTLLGMGIAAKFGAQLRFASFGVMILLVDGVAGLLVAPLGLVQAAWQAAVLMLTLGLLAGYMQINVFTWIQRRVPPRMMGRAMSIFMFIFMGLAPLSAASAGWLLTLVSLSQLFIGGGIILVMFALLAYVFTPMRSIVSITA
ncbi:MFS transporter [Duganella sp. sic0402]|uniref:MFS transporter n=1 Tax=Duganella sp. sic0402 TaxID=2854786 RepID=UPI001C48EE34|nr:MFS transporter [Duganella sp. sic0402]MBV7536660.1 MFS transporter [Duganella sp. sic0402]